jgi:hypothetical protein
MTASGDDRARELRVLFEQLGGTARRLYRLLADELAGDTLR